MPPQEDPAGSSCPTQSDRRSAREVPHPDIQVPAPECSEEDAVPVPVPPPHCTTRGEAPIPAAITASEHDNQSATSVSNRKLQPTRGGQPLLGEVGSWEGYVAAEAYNVEGWTTDIVITTPNAKWVPEIAVAHSEITTFDDGRWGRHEYSQWPQQFARDAFHIHCIPAKPRSGGPREVLWRTVCKQDWKPDDCGVVGVRFLDRNFEKELAGEASDAMKRFQARRLNEKEQKGWNEIGDFLVACLRHTMDRLRCLPAVPGVIISLAAHVQRLTLELFGLAEWLAKVCERVKTKQDYRHLVLDVVGAHTSDPSVAQMLHQAGIPVWLQQAFSTHLAVYKVVLAQDVPPEFSKTPSYPRMVLAKRDLSGALNLPGEWQRAMATIVRRQLCDSRLPALLEAEKDGSLPPAKRLREGAVFLYDDSASVGPATPSFVVRNAQDSKSLGHDLPVAPSTSTHQPTKPSRRTRARHAKKLMLAAAPVDDPASSIQSHIKGDSMNPFRQLYFSRTVAIPHVWSFVLSKMGPLPQPRASVKYFFAPPWLLDALVDFPSSPDKTARYLHHWISIRAFCRVRLFDKTIAGRPLTVSEWRDALWGNYQINEEAQSSSQPQGARWKVRKELQANIHRLFGQGQSLPSYRVDAKPLFGNSVVTNTAAVSDHTLQRRVVWEAHETNWRCELLALDALMTGSNDWTELLRWMRESLVSQVWGPGTSGLDVVPSVEENDPPAFCWLAPPEEGWESCRLYLSAFVELLGHWPGCPDGLCGAHGNVLNCGADEFSRILDAAVTFYASTFVSKFDRLPVPPVHASPSFGA